MGVEGEETKVSFFGLQSIIFFVAHLTPEHGIRIDDIPYHHRKNNHRTPEGKAKGFPLRRSFLQSYGRRDGIRVKRGNKAQVPGQEKGNTVNEGLNLPARSQASPELKGGNQSEQGKNPDKVETGRTEPISPDQRVMVGGPDCNDGHE
jgi:hypothetical protein